MQKFMVNPRLADVASLLKSAILSKTSNMSSWSRRRFNSRGPSTSSSRVNDANAEGSRTGARQRHPSHLKGREIGLWYARQNKAKNCDGEPRRELLNYLRIEEDLRERCGTCLSRLEAERKNEKGRNLGTPRTKSYDAKPTSTKSQKAANPSPAIQAFRAELPVYKARAEILQKINKYQATVISGETGSGKTTQVPQFILDQYFEDESRENCFVICTQPRRISAITVAERVAYERGETVGQNSVGYKIRLESKEPLGNNGKILYCTTGIVLQFLQSDPLLENVTHLIVDEVHERSLHSDLLLGILRQKILPNRPDLKVICMSATLDSQLFVSYFGENCGCVSVEGKLFPVEDHFLEDFYQLLKYNPAPSYQSKFQRSSNDEARRERNRFLENAGFSKAQALALSQFTSNKVDTDLVVSCIEHICSTCDDGAILVFMPGWDGISDVCKKLSGYNTPSINSRNSLILPLHSMLPTDDQRRVFDKPKPGVRKIIVSTVIAETSVTIEDVVYVVDSGKTKLTTIDVAKNNLNCLGEQWISKANAQQRLGRAGRVQPGKCYKLFTRKDHETLEDYQQPEMARSSLEGLILYVKELKLGEPEVFLPQCLTPPAKEAVDNSMKFLCKLGALDHETNLTTLGKHLSSFPVEPRIGKLLLLGSMFNCLEPVFSICASLDFKDPFTTPMGMEQEVDSIREDFADGTESDHVMIANVVEKARKADHNFCRRNFLSFQNMKMLMNLRDQYRTLLQERGFPETNLTSNLQTLRAVICGGLYPCIAVGKFRETQRSPRLQCLFTETENRLVFHPKSVLAKQRDISTQFFAYFLKQRTSNGVFIFDATAVHPLSLLIFANECTYNSTEEIFYVNGYMRIRCGANDAQFVKRLRSAFDYVFDSFLRREQNKLHLEFLTLLNQAFNDEICEMVSIERTSPM